MSKNLLCRILFRFHHIFIRPILFIHHVLISHFLIIIAHTPFIFLVSRLTETFYIFLILLIFLILQVFLRTIRIVTFIILLSTCTRPCCILVTLCTCTTISIFIFFLNTLDLFLRNASSHQLCCNLLLSFTHLLSIFYILYDLIIGHLLSYSYTGQGKNQEE